jgi:predicted heme/steroid binding protein
MLQLGALEHLELPHSKLPQDLKLTVSYLQTPKLNLTETELARYTGEDPTLPIYLAINGSIFDVSSNPHMYGPGGGYGHFAGRDAARAFVSGCFQTDLTHDLRGLEQMFITGKSRSEDDAEILEISQLEIKRREMQKIEDLVEEQEEEVGHPLGHPNREELLRVEGRIRWLRQRRQKRKEMAMEKVRSAVQHWDRFFREHERYFYVGQVMHESLEGTPIRELCEGKKKPGTE